MPQPGDIVVERLTGRRAIVITTPTADELTVRFPDGRLENRFVFELEPPLTRLGTLLELLSLSLSWPARAGDYGPRVVRDRSRPQLVRQGPA
jgi:hypothetical protein